MADLGGWKILPPGGQGGWQVLPPTDFRGEGGGRGSALEAGLIGARQGVTLGFGDEINAGVRAIGDALPQFVGGGGKPLGESYNARLEHERGLLGQTRQENPVASTVGEIGGSMLLPAGAAGSATTLAGAAGRGALAGGGFGAAYGAGEGEGAAGRLRGAAEGAAAGALFGAGASAALHAGAKGVQRLTRNGPQRPTVESLRRAKDAAYRVVDQAGDVFQPAELQAMVQQADNAISGGLSTYVPAVDQQTAASLEVLKRHSGQPLTLGQLDNIRQSLWKRAGKAPDEPGVEMAIDAIDDLISSHASSSDLMDAARGAHSRYKKAEMLENAFKKARDQTASTGSGGNILNKYRQAVTAIVNDPKKSKWFSPEEMQVMQQLIDGSASENLMRRIGKLAPSGNGLMMALNLLGAGATGGSSLLVTGIAAGAKEIADQSAENAVERTLAKISTGSIPQRQAVRVRGAAPAGYLGERVTR